ncbi:MAG: hypothetical protein CMI05_13010, partial [Oceanospirillaceae bacterium]|nr:hypothetical protein [Oceanospirillaceae bacterium]
HRFAEDFQNLARGAASYRFRRSSTLYARRVPERMIIGSLKTFRTSHAGRLPTGFVGAQPFMPAGWRSTSLVGAQPSERMITSSLKISRTGKRVAYSLLIVLGF